MVDRTREAAPTGAEEMISAIQIRGYRAFHDFEMGSLGRINLLVGTNNSGKTSVLEAIYLLISRGDPLALWQIVWRRGERLGLAERMPNRPLELAETQGRAPQEARGRVPSSAIRSDRTTFRTLEVSMSGRRCGSAALD